VTQQVFLASIWCPRTWLILFSKYWRICRRRERDSQCENGRSKSLLSARMAKSCLQPSLTKSHISSIRLSRSRHEVRFFRISYLTLDFKKPPFKLEEQGWGEFDMAITLHFAEKGGTKELAHDLHFQQPKYEISHTVV